MKQYLEAGRLCSPRGIKGELRFDCWCDSPEFLNSVKKLYLDSKGEKFLEISQYRPSIPSIIFKGFEDRNSASVLTGKTVYFDRKDIKLPKGVYFNDDLISAPVFNVSGEKIGVLVEIEESPRGFYYIVKSENMEYSIPYNDAFVKSISPEKIIVELIEGLGREIKISKEKSET
jgi:16S rRNA processing protein RimM